MTNRTRVNVMRMRSLRIAYKMKMTLILFNSFYSLDYHNQEKSLGKMGMNNIETYQKDE